MKDDQAGFGIIELLLIIVTLGLIGGIGYAAYSRVNTAKNTESTRSATPMPPLVRGVYGANVSDPAKYLEVPGLKDALKKIADDNPCQPTEGRFKQIVLGVTSDQTQALIGNSCGSTGVLRTFMIKQGDGWKSIGAWKDEAKRTDFSALTDTPSCEIVEQHKVQKSIAPVCYRLHDAASDLMAGDMNDYSYVVR